MKTSRRRQTSAATRRFPDARTTQENVQRGLLDESYLAVSPFDIDEDAIRRRVPRKPAQTERPRAAPASPSSR
jgi:hypothetical protein